MLVGVYYCYDNFSTYQLDKSFLGYLDLTSQDIIDGMPSSFWFDHSNVFEYLTYSAQMKVKSMYKHPVEQLDYSYYVQILNDNEIEAAKKPLTRDTSILTKQLYDMAGLDYDYLFKNANKDIKYNLGGNPIKIMDRCKDMMKKMDTMNRYGNSR